MVPAFPVRTQRAIWIGSVNRTARNLVKPAPGPLAERGDVLLAELHRYSRKVLLEVLDR
jgi:hypothetical protein